MFFSEQLDYDYKVGDICKISLCMLASSHYFEALITKKGEDKFGKYVIILNTYRPNNFILDIENFVDNIGAPKLYFDNKNYKLFVEKVM